MRYISLRAQLLLPPAFHSALCKQGKEIFFDEGADFRCENGSEDFFLLSEVLRWGYRNIVILIRCQRTFPSQQSYILSNQDFYPSWDVSQHFSASFLPIQIDFPSGHRILFPHCCCSIHKKQFVKQVLKIDVIWLYSLNLFALFCPGSSSIFYMALTA